MGWFSSKTVTYVSSSTSPMFDNKKRVDNFQAALIDHTSTLSMEQSEYLRAHYNSSRLKNIWGFINWAERSGFNNALGKVTTVFYGDAKFDNTVVTNALKPLISLPTGYTDFGVYSTTLSFFSEDFWVRHLATQQGKAHWFYNPTSANYTLSYPTPTTIRATFKDGKTLEGPLPSFEPGTRFLEICYSVITKKTEQKPPAKPGEPPITVITYDYDYGFYLYREKSGSPVLDNLIVNNGVHGTQSFYPVIPLRTNTWWITDGREAHINEALRQLQLYDPKKGYQVAFKNLRENCEKGMKEGNIGDIDYITLLLGVTINSRNKADQRYLFEFFYNCYANYALSIGERPQSILGGKPLYTGSGHFGFFHKRLLSALHGGQEDNYYSKFQIWNGTSNFNYTYGWVSSDYFEANGQFKPGAKVGDYGTLAGEYVYTYRHQVPATDSEGNVITTGNSEDGYKVVMTWETVTTKYNLTFFCHQFAVNRWKAVAFADLKLVNLVYAGKSVNTDAYEAVKDSEKTAVIKHDFTGDYDGAYQTWDLLTFEYVEITGDSDSAFIVPLEQNTLYECGQKTALDISYGCYYLVFNCWVQKKKKWYQSGFFGAVISFVGVALSFMFPALAPLILLVTGIFIVNTVLTLLQKVLSLVFGERWATRIVDFALQIIKGIVGIIGSIAFKIPVIGWIVWGICTAIQFNLTAGEILWKGGTMSQAIKGGAKAAIVSGIASAVAGQIAGPASTGTSASGATAGSSATIGSMANQVVIAGSAMTAGQFVAMSATHSFISGSLGSLLDGKSLGSSLKEGFKQGAIAGALAYMTSVANDLGWSNSLKGSIKDFSQFQNYGMMDWVQLAGNMFIDKLVNINTFASLMQMSIEEVQFHRMANLENDFQEFNNKYSAANKVLNQLAESVSGTTTAESVCRLQACMGRVLTTFPDTLQSLDTETILAMSILAGSDSCKVVLGNIDCWCDSQLAMDGYSPSDLHYSTFSYTMTHDANLRTGT